MEKNHNHSELPHQDHTDDFTDEQTQEAVEFYVGGDRLKELPVATSSELKTAWGAMDQEDLDGMELVALKTNDKEALEALEERKRLKEEKKMEKEAAKKRLPSKNTGASLAKTKRQLQKAKVAKKRNEKGSGSKVSGRPGTPPPLPANQLQHNIHSDHDQTPTKGEFWNT